MLYKEYVRGFYDANWKLTPSKNIFGRENGAFSAESLTDILMQFYDSIQLTMILVHFVI